MIQRGSFKLGLLEGSRCFLERTVCRWPTWQSWNECHVWNAQLITLSSTVASELCLRQHTMPMISRTASLHRTINRIWTLNRRVVKFWMAFRKLSDVVSYTSRWQTKREHRSFDFVFFSRLRWISSRPESVMISDVKIFTMDAKINRWNCCWPQRDRENVSHCQRVFGQWSRAECGVQSRTRYTSILCLERRKGYNSVFKPTSATNRKQVLI